MGEGETAQKEYYQFLKNEGNEQKKKEEKGENQQRKLSESNEKNHTNPKFC